MKPPAIHTASIDTASPVSEATTAGVRKMPLPTTLEMMMAAASTGPSRRSRTVEVTGLAPCPRHRHAAIA